MSVKVDGCCLRRAGGIREVAVGGIIVAEAGRTIRGHGQRDVAAHVTGVVHARWSNPLQSGGRISERRPSRRNSRYAALRVRRGQGRDSHKAIALTAHGPLDLPSSLAFGCVPQVAIGGIVEGEPAETPVIADCPWPSYTTCARDLTPSMTNEVMIPTSPS